MGGPDEVIDKIRHYDEVLGGITRLTFQMDLAALPHATLMRAIELIGTRVAPSLQTAMLVSVWGLCMITQTDLARDAAVAREIDLTTLFGARLRGGDR